MLKWIAPICITAVLALILWPKPQPTETDLFIPIEITALPKGLVTTGMPLEGVEIRVRGPEKTVHALSNRQLVYRLDLSGGSAGIKSISLNPERFGLPREISILHIHPDPLILRIETEVTKKVPVRVTLSGEPAAGFYVAATRPIPPVAVLRGPESRVEAVAEVRTRPVDISGVHETTKKEVALDLIEGIQAVAPGEVILAEVTLAKVIEARTFSAVPLGGKNTPHCFTITPPRIDIEVKGPANTLKKLAAEGIDAYVDLKGLAPGMYPRRAVISLPVDTTLLKAAPEIFTVKIDSQALSGAAEAEPCNP